MSDARAPLAASPALALRPGRFGRPDGAPGIAVAELTGLALVSIAVRRDAALTQAFEAAYGIAPPDAPRFVPGAPLSLIWSGPGLWLAIAEADGEALEAGLAEKLRGLAFVTDRSDGFAVLEISGPAAREMLSRLLPMDLHPRAFGPGDTAVTVAEHIGVQIWQLDDAPAYRLAFPRSYAGSFWRAVAAASAPFGYEVRSP